MGVCVGCTPRAPPRQHRPRAQCWEPVQGFLRKQSRPFPMPYSFESDVQGVTSPVGKAAPGAQHSCSDAHALHIAKKVVLHEPYVKPYIWQKEGCSIRAQATQTHKRGLMLKMVAQEGIEYTAAGWSLCRCFGLRAKTIHPAGKTDHFCRTQGVRWYDLAGKTVWFLLHTGRQAKLMIFWRTQGVTRPSPHGSHTPSVCVSVCMCTPACTRQKSCTWCCRCGRSARRSCSRPSSLSASVGTRC
jgi:hypothetical protein